LVGVEMTMVRQPFHREMISLQLLQVRGMPWLYERMVPWSAGGGDTITIIKRRLPLETIMSPFLQRVVDHL